MITTDTLYKMSAEYQRGYEDGFKQAKAELEETMIKKLRSMKVFAEETGTMETL